MNTRPFELSLAFEILKAVFRHYVNNIYGHKKKRERKEEEKKTLEAVIFRKQQSFH